MILETAYLELPENTWRFFRQLQQKTLNYAPLPQKDWAVATFETGLGDFKYWHGREVGAHADGINALRAFWVLDNQRCNWVIRGARQHVGRQPEGTVIVLDIGKDHEVFGHNLKLRPWILLSYGNIHTDKQPKEVLNEALDAFSKLKAELG